VVLLLLVLLLLVVLVVVVRSQRPLPFWGSTVATTSAWV
jgi:hypothetical protein